ncbi:MAG: hypothetical protein Q7O66_02975 [Dehalococcoidia bacterium]|nr:hypothetical protein [Dehalococcoidia bacterium]
MKEIVTFTASVSREDASSGWQGIAEAYLQPLSPINVGMSPFGMVAEFVFDYLPQSLDQINVNLERFGISGCVYIRRVYEPEELLGSDFLELRAGLDVTHIAGTLTGDSHSPCPFCGFKETRWNLPAMRVKEAPRGYQLAKVSYAPLVVSHLLADEIRQAGCSGVRLIPLGKDNSADWYALHITSTLPPIQSPPTQTERPWSTPFCKSDHNLGQKRSQLFYRRQDYEAMDFNQTLEVFGGRLTPQRCLIVSNRVHYLLAEHGVEQLIFEPIRLTD